MTRIDCGAFYLAKRPGLDAWFVRASHPRRAPLFKSTKTDDEKKARRRAREIYDDWSKDKRLQPGDKILWCDLWSEFYQYREPYVSVETHKRMDSIAQNHLLRFFSNLFLNEVLAAWTSFVIEQRKVRPKSILFNERKYLLASMQYAFEQGLTEREPYLPAIKSKEDPIGKSYTDDEVRRLIEFCDHPDLKVIIKMCFYMGMRLGEVSYLEIDRVDLNERTVTLGRADTKTRKARTITISDEVFQDIEFKVKTLGKLSPWLFPQVRNRMQPIDIAYWQKLFQRLRNKAGVKGRIHDLRHSCATRLATAGVPPVLAASYLGMSLRVFDSTYCHLDEDDTKIASQTVKLTVFSSAQKRTRSEDKN